MWACLSVFFFILQHSVLFVLVVLYVLSYPPPLPSPLQTSLGCSWFVLCYSLSSGCRAKTGPRLLVFPVMRGGGLMPPGHRLMIRKDPLQAQSECRLNVLLLYLQQPPPAALPPAHTQTDRHSMRTCTSHLKLTHLPLEECWHHFSTSLCVIIVLHISSYSCTYSNAVCQRLSKPVFVYIYLSSPQ